MEVSGFPHQVGGHFGIFRTSGHICKPMNEREFRFYSKMTEHQLAPYMPRLCGRVRVHLLDVPSRFSHLLNSHSDDGTDVKLITSTVIDCHRSECTVASDASSHQMIFRLKKCGRMETFDPNNEISVNPWAYQCQSKVVQKLFKGNDITFMLLEDVVRSFINPSIIDLKMGTRQYGDDASDDKQLSQIQKCRSTTSEDLGVRLVGMQLFKRDTNRYGYINKYEGRRMTKEGFFDSLRDFFHLAGEQRVKELIRKLSELEAILLSLVGFRFFSSSLLISYDGNPDSGHAVNSHATSESHQISVKMIDFAHSTFKGFQEDDINYTGSDEGYILGIRSLLSFLKVGITLEFDSTSNDESKSLKRSSIKRKHGDTDMIPDVIKNVKSESTVK